MLEGVNAVFEIIFLMDYKDEIFICLYKKIFENIYVHNRDLVLLYLLAY